MADAAHLTPEARLFDKLERDAFDSDAMARGGAARLSAAGAVLKAQGAVLRDIRDSRNLGPYIANLTLAALLFSAAYGAVLGMFQPGLQTLYAAAKLPVVVLGTALLCTPTFHVFNSVLGSRFTLAQTFGIVILMVSATTLILIAFAPIAWFFTVSTEGRGFLVAFHAAVFLVSLGFGMRLLDVAQKYLAHLDAAQRPIHGGFLRFWSVIVLFVGLQMAYYFRPLLEPGPFWTAERGLFFEVLGPLLGGPAR